MHAQGLAGSPQLYNSLLSACQAKGAWDLALDTFLGGDGSLDSLDSMILCLQSIAFVLAGPGEAGAPGSSALASRGGSCCAAPLMARPT